MRNNDVSGEQPCTSANALSNHNQLNNSFQSTDNVPDDEIERRRCAYKSQSKIKDELRKAQQGISCGANIDKLFSELEEQNDLGTSQTLRTLKADGQTLEQMTRLSITELDRMRNETAKSLDPELFVVRLKNFANRNVDNAGENIFITLGRQYSWLLRCVPDFDYEKQQIVPKKPKQNVRRVIKKKIKLEQQEIVAKSLRQLHEEEEGSTSVSKELDNVTKHLRRLFKQQKTDKIDYYKFVLNPNERTGFGDTIENMFYVSFLIKDGSIGLKINEQGVPIIVKISKEERNQRIQRNEFDTTQVLGRLDYSTWKKLVQKLDITEAYITRKAVEKRDPIEENEE